METLRQAMIQALGGIGRAAMEGTHKTFVFVPLKMVNVHDNGGPGICHLVTR